MPRTSSHRRNPPILFRYSTAARSLRRRLALALIVLAIALLVIGLHLAGVSPSYLRLLAGGGS